MQLELDARDGHVPSSDRVDDVLLLGRGGVGKTSLLEAIAGRSLGSSPLGPGSEGVRCYDVHVQRPIVTKGRMASLVDICVQTVRREKVCYEGRLPHGLEEMISRRRHLRFWDTPGTPFDDPAWEQALDDFFADLDRRGIHPACVFYCTCGTGRLRVESVEKCLSHFYDKGSHLFWVVTNMYSMGSESLRVHLQQGLDLMATLSSSTPRQPPGEDTWACGDRCFAIAVNSQPFEVAYLGTHLLGRKNVDALMQICFDELVRFDPPEDRAEGRRNEGGEGPRG